MARRRFFVPEIRRGTAELTGQEAEHLVRVLRVEPGQLFEISDNQHAYLAEIETARKSSVVFRISEPLPSPEPAVQIALFPALFKFDSFEWMVEKVTELGIVSLQPFEAVRSERGLSRAAEKRMVRWRKIALEASQQSRRLHLPEIEPPAPFSQVLHNEAELHLLLDENAAAPPIVSVLPENRSLRARVALLSGPEGGWIEEERHAAHQAGWKSCSLGQTVLRAETAAISAVAVLRAAWPWSPGNAAH
jgi:16S rRNA (uracil1498-N3)-methyltransferase